MEWGSSEKDAIAKYGKPDVDGEGWIVYNYTLASKSVTAGFFYKKDKLYRGAYLLMESHTNKNMYITDYDFFKNLLSKKYGLPKKDITYWANDLYKEDYSDWGMAISVGHLFKVSNWSTGKTDIECSLSGDNYKITCKIVYNSIELKDFVEKINNEDILDDF